MFISTSCIYRLVYLIFIIQISCRRWKCRRQAVLCLPFREEHKISFEEGSFPITRLFTKIMIEQIDENVSNAIMAVGLISFQEVSSFCLCRAQHCCSIAWLVASSCHFVPINVYFCLSNLVARFRAEIERSCSAQI